MEAIRSLGVTRHRSGDPGARLHVDLVEHRQLAVGAAVLGDAVDRHGREGVAPVGLGLQPQRSVGRLRHLERDRLGRLLELQLGLPDDRPTVDAPRDRGVPCEPR